ncbi:MAG: hypothetical protein KDB03_20675, partial [Planctomycetales bacterium]|nr:hypothetical protein [Planctomycetales bacterium]
RLVARALSGEEAIPEVAVPYYRYVVGLLGATDAAFFVLFAFIAKYPFYDGAKWAHLALSAGLLTWFILDSAFSISVGAGFNILCVNIPCLLLLGIPLILTVRHFYPARH